MSIHTIDLTPLYRSTVGFDHLASLLNHAATRDNSSGGYPPYNIEAFEENKYSITLALAGFSEEELDIQVENGVLLVKGSKQVKDESNYLYQGIANRSFERKFNLADHMEVTGANLNNGLLTINLVKEIPEAMKPKTIAINKGSNVLEHKSQSNKAA